MSALDDTVASETPFYASILAEAERQILSQTQLQELILREQVRHNDWFLKNDVTGRVRLISQKRRLERAIVLLQIP